jgi:hypothetical protein
MATDIFRSSLIITRLPSMFALAQHDKAWKAVCLRCGSVVVENGELSEIWKAEGLHHCEPNEVSGSSKCCPGQSGR